MKYSRVADQFGRDFVYNIFSLHLTTARHIGTTTAVRVVPADRHLHEYGEIHQYQLDEYREYVDMAELPEDIGDELHDWEIDEVKYLREVCDLPDRIEPPRTWTQIDWMVDFANGQSIGSRFVKDAQRAIDSRHPFIDNILIIRE